MNKKGRILVNSGQIKDETPPPKPHKNLKILECENANKISKNGIACDYYTQKVSKINCVYTISCGLNKCIH